MVDLHDSDSEDEDLFQMGQVVQTGHASVPQDDIDAAPSYVKPNYQAALEYWNTLLPRRIKDPSQPSGYRQALVGEMSDENGQPAELYDFFKTDSAALDEFGIGMSLYFRTLKMMGLVCFVCALILLVSVDENMKNQLGVSPFTKAGLSDVEDSIGVCEVSYGGHGGYVFDRNTTETKLSTHTNLLGSTYGATPQSLSAGKQGAADIIIFCICMIVMIHASRLEKKEVEKIDLAQQTTQDYSVVVKNPPSNCTDPQEYYDFFSKFGEVVTLTVALKNGALMKAIADRKVLSMTVDSLRSFEALKSPEELEKGDSFVDKVKRFLGKDLESSEAKLKDMDDKIVEMSKCVYHPWRIFVSFNKEEEQRRCLSELATSDLQHYLGFADLMTQNEEAIFHGKVLDVAEAPEPTDVIYNHCHRTKLEVYLRLILSYVITGFAIFCVMLIITSLQNVNGTVTELIVALFISGMNAGLPIGIRILTQIVEAHSSETGSQRSVLNKLIIARCMNSAILIYVLTPWHSKFSHENLQQIQIILLSDAVFTPLFRFVNVWEVVKRRFLAPYVFGKTQAGYNSQFQGTKWTLAERYTDALKSVFAGFFFAVPLPTGLFISSFAMMSTYMVDKYCLMRIWERKPTIDHSLAKLARYFLIMTLWTHLFISMIYFTNWPYSYGGLEEGKSCDFNCPDCPNREDVIKCDFIFVFCKPNMSYMTQSQYDAVLTYLIFSITVGAAIILYLFFIRTGKKILGNLQADTKEIGEASDIPLRSVFGAPAYVPSIKLKQITAPFVFSDISKLPVRFSPVRESSGWDETLDPKNFSLVDRSYFPGVSEDNFKSMFSTTTFYETKNVFSQLAHEECSTSELGGSEVDGEAGVEMSSANNVEVEHRITEADFNSSTFVSTDGLPSGWEKRITKDGRTFYVDHNELKITHLAPAPLNFNEMSFRLSSLPSVRAKHPSFRAQSFKTSKSARRAMLCSQSSRLMSTNNVPAGWEQKYTKDGRVYYVDHNSKTTHWSLPSQMSMKPRRTSSALQAVDEDQV